MRAAAIRCVDPTQRGLSGRRGHAMRRAQRSATIPPVPCARRSAATFGEAPHAKPLAAARHDTAGDDVLRVPGEGILAVSLG
jgi:hypothetical protein